MASGKDIAIIGMACTFPGARDLRQYWSNICRKVDAVGDAPPDWDTELFFDPESGANDRTYCKRGGFLGPLAEFTPSDFGVMPQSVDGTEPDHFLALRAAAEALADAGYRKENPYRERTSVVIGRGTYVNRGNTTAIQHSLAVDAALRVLKQIHPEHSDEELALIKQKIKESLPPFEADTSAGLVPNIISGRIANRLDLMGPNYIVDAACASSLVAVDLAAQDLLSGRCDMAVAGGVHASTTPVILIIFSHLKALSRKGQLRPFDADADGTLLGEGVGMVVLKRLGDAERDGDRIYAVLKGIGSASDGRALGLLAPRLEGEVLALRRAYEAAGCDPSTVGLLEAHGTGTLVGDATELEALNAVFGSQPGEPPRCALGSVKSMISHTMPAAGMAGLIKAALALHHKVLPPTLHCENPNPKLNLDQSRFYLNTETRPWIHGGSHPRRAGVNAFGFGGINAHAVLEEYNGPHPAPSLAPEWDSHLFVFSGADVPGVIEHLKQVQAWVQADGEMNLRDLSWTMTCHQPIGSARLAMVAASRAELEAKIAAALQRLAASPARKFRDQSGIFFFPEPLGGEGRVAVLFPGDGAQYPNMLADVCTQFAEVRDWFDLMDAAFQDHPRGYLPSEAVFPPPMTGANARLFAMDAGAEAVFTANQGMWALLSRLGLKPAAFVGHSTGEHTALLASGAVAITDRSQMVRHVLGVNRVFEELNRAGRLSDGVMVAIAGLDHGKLAALASQRDDLFFALDNCEHQAVLCGSEASIEWIQEKLKGTPAVCQRLSMARAYHTPLFTGFADGLRAHFRTLDVTAPHTAVYSCVTASRYPADPDAIRELASVQWSSTVRFRETIQSMHQDGIRVFLECGPRGNLTAFVDDILRGKPYIAIAANVTHRPALTQLQHMAGMLIAHGVDLDLSSFYPGEQPKPYASRAAAPVRKAKPMRIRTGLQPLGLPEDFHLPKPAAPAPVSEPAPTPVSQDPGVEPEIEPSRASAAAAAAAVPAGRAAVMERYMAGMRQFLESQEAVMRSYMLSRSAPRRASQPPSLPFAREVVSLEPDVRAVVRHRLQPNRDTLLLHHTLGRQVSESDTALTGLPVLPLTFTMEMLAQAGSVLMPGQVLTGMREIRATRWLTVESEFDAELTVRRGPSAGTVHVEMRPAGSSGPAWAEGTMVFGTAYPAAPAASPLPDGIGQPSAWRDDRLYVDGMFHGASFQAVKSMRLTGKGGTVADMEVMPRNALFAGERDPRLLTDAVILDAAGQVVAFWSQEQLLPQGDIFPFRLVKLDCYRPPQPAGTRLECRVFVRAVTETDIESDIEIVDQAGQLHCRLEGWWDRRFRPPRCLWDARVTSGKSLIASPWSEPLSAYGGSAGLACAFVDTLPDSLLEASHGIWAHMLANIVLSRREREEWRRLNRSAVPKRRADWLRGRCAAKDAVRLLVKDRTGATLSAADVEIVSGPLGEPRVEGAWMDRLGLRPVVSLSHSGEAAVALAALDPRSLVGIDLESVTRAAANLGESHLAFQDSERGMVGQLAPGAQPQWFLRLWCAKEAVAKALGRGMGEGLRSLEVTGLDAENGWVRVQLRNGLADAFPHLKNETFVAYTRADSRFVLSAVVRPTQ